MNDFEAITKFFLGVEGLKVYLRPGVPPYANHATREIWLPSEILEDPAAVAIAIHEVGHIKFTTFDPRDIVADEKEGFILNCMEDARINMKLLEIIPEIRVFIEMYYAFLKNRKKPSFTLPMKKEEVHALLNCITECETLTEFKNQAADVCDIETRIYADFRQGVHGLETKDYTLVKASIKNIKAILWT